MDATQELQIDPSTALVVIDLQKGIASRQTAPYDTKTVVSNAALLTQAFRKKNMPVFLVHVVSSGPERLNVISDEGWAAPKGPMPADWSDLVEELKQAPTDIIITKHQWGAFYGTELDLQLRRRGIKKIVLCGIATSYGVESTARFAYEYGYQQVFAEDATSDMSKEAHDAAIKYVFRRMGRVRSTQQILDAIK